MLIILCLNDEIITFTTWTESISYLLNCKKYLIKYYFLQLIQQTAQETGRPRNSYILELIDRSQRSQPNLCQLSEGVAACRKDVLDLNKLLGDLEVTSARQEAVPSLMEELRAVAEKV